LLLNYYCGTMLETLISSKTRIKLLMKFFLNAKSRAYLRNLEAEFGDSTNGIRVELNKFEQAGLLQAEIVGNKKYYKANQLHPLYSEIHSILLKHIGLDQVIDEIIVKMGDLQQVYIVGDFAKGIDSNIIDLLIVGENVNSTYLMKLIAKVEGMIKRKLSFLILNPLETITFLLNKKENEYLLLWEK